MQFSETLLARPNVKRQRGNLVHIGDGFPVFRKVDLVQVLPARLTNLYL